MLILNTNTNTNTNNNNNVDNNNGSRKKETPQGLFENSNNNDKEGDDFEKIKNKISYNFKEVPHSNDTDSNIYDGNTHNYHMIDNNKLSSMNSISLNTIQDFKSSIYSDNTPSEANNSLPNDNSQISNNSIKSDLTGKRLVSRLDGIVYLFAYLLLSLLF